MIKLIASDIDGTLVVDGTPVLNPEYFTVIRELKKHGIVFAAASGRQFTSIYKLFEPVSNDIIFVAENGSYVSCRGYDILAEVIDKDMLTELITDIRGTKGAEIMFSSRKKAYVETKDQNFINWMVDGYKYNLEEVDDLLALDVDCIKIALYHPTDATGIASPFFIPKWKERMTVVCAGKEWVDCTLMSANKGHAITSIQKSLGITKEETMVFGDNLNDISMLERAKYSYAIGNARKEVKDVAAYIADTNVNDGVLKELKKLLAQLSV